MSKRKAPLTEAKEPAKQSKISEIDEDETATDEDDEYNNEEDESGNHPGLSEYEVQRLKNIEHHAKLFETLQLGDARNALAAVSYQKRKTSIKKRQEPRTIVPRRVSIRLLAKQSDSRSKLLELSHSSESEPTEQQLERERRPPGPIPLKTISSSDSEEEHKMLVESLRKADIKVSEKQPETLGDLKQYSLLLQKLSLNEKCVTKLVPARITSLAFHPFTASPVIAAGDKRGHLGIWQVGLGEEDGVFLFEPHIQPLTCLKYGVNQPELLFSTSYDSTVRCMDLNKEVFDEVFSLPEVEEVQFHGLAFVSNDSTSLLISCSDGTVHAVDTREARKRCPKYKLHTKSVKCIDIHPVNADYFVTSSSDR
jgi:WD40 repeat protein